MGLAGAPMWKAGRGRSSNFLEGLHAHRFIQSFKTFAASATFQETRIFRERYRFEDLLTAFLRTLVRHGGSRT